MGGGEQSTSNPGHRPKPLPDSQTPLKLEPSEPYPVEGHVLLSPLPGRAVSFPLIRSVRRGQKGEQRVPRNLLPTGVAVPLLLDIPNPHQVSGLVLRQPRSAQCHHPPELVLALTPTQSPDGEARHIPLGHL